MLMQTHHKLLFCLASSVTGLLIATVAPANETPTIEKPNIIVIFCDDMGYADIGPFGAQGYETPHLQRMADEGMKFTDFYVSRSVCSPSRAGLMTGCYNVRVGVPGNFNPRSTTGLNPSEMILPEVVKPLGYATAMYGKWHLGHLPPFLPTSRGFDEWYGLPYSNDMWPLHPSPHYDFPDLPLMEGEKIVKAAITPEDQTQLTKSYTERTVKFIESHQDQPFLIYLAHAMPHVPLYASEAFDGKTGRGIFGDVITEIDWGVGRILDTLERLDLDQKTLVIFTSDNGPWLSYGDHGGSAYPLREGKGTFFEGGFRVPCLMWWPGSIPANTTCDQLASTIDVLPTVAHLTGGSWPSAKIDGKNIWPLMSGQEDAVSPHEAFFYYNGAVLSAVRSGQWKLIFPQTYGTVDEPGKEGRPGTSRPQRIERSLFDLQNDISESTNVAAQHPDIVARLQQAADAMREELGDGERPGKAIRPVGRIED